MGVQMASRWAFRRSRLKDGDPELLFRLNGDIVFTKDYVKHTLFTKKPYGHGTQGIITNIHYGPLGGVSHVDVRLPKGEFVREVPVNFFLA
jgi:hypothetical protein